MIILSVDYGRVRTGIAVCDKNEIIASPVAVIKETEADMLAVKISDIAKEKKAEMIVLGLPKNMDGTEGESALNVRAFSEILREKSGLCKHMISARTATSSVHAQSRDQCMIAT